MSLKISKEKIIFILLLAMYLFFRFFLIKDGNFIFFYDQGRDAILAREIYQDHDLKIQGPTASGSSDTLFHGVFYYYLLALLYWAFAGNPQLVSYGLFFLSSVTLLVMFYLVMKLSKSRLIAFFAVFLLAINLDQSILSSWLSNPQLLTWILPIFYLLTYLVFIEKKDQFLPVLTLSLALSNQAAIYTLYLGFTLLIFYSYRAIEEKKLLLFSLKNIFISLLLYFLGVGTMLLNQFLLYKNGIFSLTSLDDGSHQTQNYFLQIIQITKLYALKFSHVFFGQQTGWAFLPFLFIVSQLKKFKKGEILFFLAILLGPGILLILQNRGTYHFFIGIEFIFILLFCIALGKLNLNASHKKLLLFSLSIIFLLINFFALVNYRQTKINILAIQQERFYQDDLALIEKTYQLAGDESFSISVLASPYGTIPSWAYLYEYYAKENNLTAPSFYGPSQNGLVAESLLREEVFPLQKHFSIIEPGFSETDKLRVDYQLEQDNYYPVKGQSYFGSLILEDRSL